MKISAGYTFKPGDPHTPISEPPLVSILIPNYNGKDILIEAINSVLGQKFPYPIELIVHDDCSTDNSIQQVITGYPMVSVIQSDENVGFCRANNRMGRQGKGTYFLLLNNDATLEADALAVMLETCQSQSPEGIVSLPQFRADTGELVDYGYNLDPFLNPIPQKTPGTPIAMVIGACLWLPSELWRKLEGFPEWFQTNAEDMYLCLTALLNGYPIQSSTLSGYKHRIGATLGGGKTDGANRLSTTLNRRALSERNKNFVMLCCYPFTLACLIFPLHAMLLILEGIVLSVAKSNMKIFGQIYWPSLRSCWKSREIISKKRKAIQNQKTITTANMLKGFRFVPQKLRLLIKHGIPSIIK